MNMRHVVTGASINSRAINCVCTARSTYGEHGDAELVAKYGFALGAGANPFSEVELGKGVLLGAAQRLWAIGDTGGDGAAVMQGPAGAAAPKGASGTAGGRRGAGGKRGRGAGSGVTGGAQSGGAAAGPDAAACVMRRRKRFLEHSRCALTADCYLCVCLCPDRICAGSQVCAKRGWGGQVLCCAVLCCPESGSVHVWVVVYDELLCVHVRHINAAATRKLPSHTSHAPAISYSCHHASCVLVPHLQPRAVGCWTRGKSPRVCCQAALSTCRPTCCCAC